MIDAVPGVGEFQIEFSAPRELCFRSGARGGFPFVKSRQAAADPFAIRSRILAADLGDGVLEEF